MSLDGDGLRALLSTAGPGAVADVLLELDEPARRALADTVRAYRDELDPGPVRPHPHVPALLVAGAGCLPTVAGVVVWLRRRELLRSADPSVAVHVARVLAAPGRPAIASVARQLAERVRPGSVDLHWPLAYALLGAAGVGPVVTDAMVRGWARYVLSSRSEPYVFSSDTWLPVMLPHLFEVDGAVADTTYWGGMARLLELCRQGRVSREALLTGCLYRMRAGDRRAPMRDVLSLHADLGPTPDEVAAHRQEYLGLLVSEQTAVAEAAQLALRALDDAGRLPVSVLAEAGEVVLLRPEKKLVRTQLRWLDAVARRDPAHLPVLVPVLAGGLGNAAVDLAEQALTVVARHLSAAGTAGRDALRAAAAELTGDLARQAHALLGEALPTARAVVAPGPASPYVALPLQPTASVGELVGELRRVLRGTVEVPLLERVLDGLVRGFRADRHGLAAALAPYISPWTGGWYGLVRAASGVDEPPSRLPSYDYVPKEPALSAVLTRRLVELADQFRAGTAPPELLATPATTDGHVDPDRMLRLLAAAERDGRQPGDADLTQALLRLPRDLDPAFTARAASLTSPAGRRLHHWLDTTPDACTALPEEPGLADLLARAGSTQSLDDAGPRSGGRLALLWPGVLPSHREVVATYLRPHVLPSIEPDRNGDLCRVLPTLARCGGPFGADMAVCLVYGLAASRSADRLYAVDALVALAVNDDFDGDLTGRVLGDLASRRVIVLRRAVDALTEASGVDAAVWDITAGALPALLGMPLPRPAGVPDLLALAAGTAAAGTTRRAVPGLAEVAGRRDRSRLVVEARRLSRAVAV
ncbi:hypothetical protein [Pseudonocardia xinjiangensis]|uniref:Secreted protein n=1 Tax=Pseudonocardia xinjiangensis TaxID=75289 RepID=A0ABX1R9C7_9PSEU|nr:hypothetical protein [Pseudonocardia xinjiangensis]NMH76386.1 hypothetical protein [Pseudonocardia xinjiangensis]